MRRPLVTAVASVALAASSLSAAAQPSGAEGEDSRSAGLQEALDDRYVVLLASDPVVAYEGDVAGLESTRPVPGEDVDPQSPQVREYVRHLLSEQRATQQAAGVQPEQVTTELQFTLNGYAAELSDTEVEHLRRDDRVAAVLQDQLIRPQTDNSPHFLGLDDEGGPWAEGYDGEGVVVSVIDSGIWPEHPSFADEGDLPEPPADTAGVPCEFGNTGYNAADAPFTCNNKLIGARDMRATYKEVVGPEMYDSARDSHGHGTHTAGTAAGNRGVDAEVFDIPRGTVSGVAPRAHVIAYKALGDLGGAESDLAAAIEQSVLDGADVINYSVGSPTAGAIGADDLAFLVANDAGVFAATSAGNAGPGAATVGSPAAWPWLTSVAASTQDRAFEGSVRLGNGEEYTGASITGGSDEAPLVDAAAAGDELCRVGELDPQVVDGAIVLCRRGENARVDKSRAVQEAGGVGMVLYDVSDDAALVTDNHFVPTVHVNLSAGQAIKAYIEDAGAEAVAQIEPAEAVPAEGYVMANFSSRGPNTAAPDVIVPDVTAPGVNILAGTTPTPNQEVPGAGAPGQLFQSASGTSMSSPHVAGVLALLKQAHPDWSAAMAKSALMTTARQDVLEEDGETPADPFDMGAGHIVASPAAAGRKQERSAFEPGLVYDARFPDYLAFLCGTDTSAILNPESVCAALEAQGFSTDPSDLNLASIGIADLAGTQTVTRRVTSVADGGGRQTYRAHVEAPAGTDVEVSPSVLRLTPGGTAEFEVTITTREDAAEGEWAFGSLTWTSEGKGAGRGRGAKGGYEVRSPIAVRPIPLEAPDAVPGTGTSGSLEIPVQFGYSGDYEPQPHGVVARDTTPGSVEQDPDQRFDPSDEVGVTAHEFTLTDTLHARWRLMHESPQVDLDVFVYDSAGERVAVSGQGATNELIDLREPGPGTYTVYVHGWGIPDGVTDYELESWVVPSGTGGSLSITSHPGSVERGAAGLVEVAWAGLAEGTEHLGAVSHRRAGELLRYTLVEVTS